MSELAWAAGLFEGEGSPHLRRWGDRVYLRAELSMADEDVVRRFCAAVGLGKVRGPYRNGDPKNKPRWQWAVTSNGETRKLLENATFLSYLGERRLKKISEMLAEFDAQPPTNRKGR